MNYSSEKQDDIFIETVNFKRATSKEEEEFKTILSNQIEKGDKKIVIDLSKCEFMDSSFLGSIIFLFKKVSELDGKMKFIVVHDDIKKLFEITGVYKLFDVYESKKQALESFKD